MIDTDPTYVQGIFGEAVKTLKGDIPKKHSKECQYGGWLKSIKDF